MMMMFFDVIERATTAERVQPSTELSGRKKRGSHFRLIKMTPPSSTREKGKRKEQKEMEQSTNVVLSPSSSAAKEVIEKTIP